MNSNNINILYIIKSLDHGITSNIIIEHVNFLSENGFKITIISHEAKLKYLLDGRIELITAPNATLSQSKLKKIIETKKITYINLFSNWLINEVIETSKNFHLNINLHSITDRSIISKNHYKILSSISKLQILCFDSYMFNKMIDLLKNSINTDIIKYIPNGINIDRYCKDNVTGAHISSAMHKLGIESNTKRILVSISEFVYDDSQFILLDALKNIETKDFICVLIGKTPDDKKKLSTIINTIKKYNLEENIIISDLDSQMYPIFTISHAILFLPLNTKIHDLTPIQAAAMFRPSLITNIEPINNMVINEKTGWVIERNNVEDLSVALKQIITLSKEKWHALCNNANTYITSHFNINKQLNSILKLYNQ